MKNSDTDHNVRDDWKLARSFIYRINTYLQQYIGPEDVSGRLLVGASDAPSRLVCPGTASQA